MEKEVGPLKEAIKISIIIPCYNYGRFLGESIHSVINQKIQKDWECIVVDDGSTDNTAEIVKEIQLKEGRVKYVYQKNEGLSAARNKGISVSAGEWIQFLDADDVLHPDKLSIQMAFTEQYPGIDIWHSSFSYFHSDDEIIEQISHGLNSSQHTVTILSSKDALLYLFKYNVMVVDAPIVSKTLVNKIGLFDTDFGSLEDWDYWTRAALCGASFGKVITSGPLAFVRKHASSMSTNRKMMLDSRIKLFLKTRDLLKHYKSDFETDFLILKKQLFSGLKYYAGDIIFEEIQRGHFSTGLKWLFAFPYSSLNDISYLTRHGLYSIKARIKE